MQMKAGMLLGKGSGKRKVSFVWEGHNQQNVEENKTKQPPKQI